jgi:hypothetical protein
MPILSTSHTPVVNAADPGKHYSVQLVSVWDSPVS